MDKDEDAANPGLSDLLGFAALRGVTALCGVLHRKGVLEDQEVGEVADAMLALANDGPVKDSPAANMLAALILEEIETEVGLTAGEPSDVAPPKRLGSRIPGPPRSRRRR